MAFHHVDARESVLMKSLHADGYRVRKIATRGCILLRQCNESVFTCMRRACHMGGGRGVITLLKFPRTL